MTKKIRKTITADSFVVAEGYSWRDGKREFLMGSEDFIDAVSSAAVWAIRIESLSTVWVTRVYHDMTLKTDLPLNVQMTLRKEQRSGTDHWYAYRRVGGVLFKRYVGQSDRLSEARIVEIAEKMPG